MTYKQESTAFAYIPTKLSNGSWIWWKYCKISAVLEDKVVFNNSRGNYTEVITICVSRETYLDEKERV